MKSFSCFIGILAVSASLVHPAAAEESLRWKFTAGESLGYQFSQSTQTETAGTGKPMRVGIDTSMSVTWKVESVDQDRVATIAQTIDQFTITMKSDSLPPISYDSSSKTTPTGPVREIADSLRKLIGVPMQIKLTERGEISAAEPSKALQDAITAKTAEQGTTPVSAAQIASSLRQASIILPEGNVVEGLVWENKHEVMSPTGPVSQASRYVYEGKEDVEGMPLHKISVNSTFTGAGSEKSTKLKISDANQTGMLWFDANSGRIRSSELTQKLVTERPYRDMNIRVLSTSTLKLKLTGK